MKVIICDKLPAQCAEKLKNAGYEVDVNVGLAPEELNKIIGNYDGCIVRSATKIRKEQIDAAKNLKIISRAGVGVDNIDVEYAKSKGIGVANTPGVTTISVAELVVGMMLSLPRHIAQANMSISEGKWEKSKFSGFEVFEKTLGVLGMGRIGTEVARRAIGLGMKVVGYDVIDIKPDIDVKMKSFDDVLKESDYITLHMPLDKEKGYVISKDELNKIKDGAYIINAARGGVLDEMALIKAIDEGKISGAALDVYETEPEVRPELQKHPKITCTPHIGAATAEGQLRAGTAVADKVIAFFNGDKSVLL